MKESLGNEMRSVEMQKKIKTSIVGPRLVVKEDQGQRRSTHKTVRTKKKKHAWLPAFLSNPKRFAKRICKKKVLARLSGDVSQLRELLGANRRVVVAGGEAFSGNRKTTIENVLGVDVTWVKCTESMNSELFIERAVAECPALVGYCSPGHRETIFKGAEK